MFIAIILIMIAWVVPMPLWLSVLATIFACFSIIGSITKFMYECVKAANE